MASEPTDTPNYQVILESSTVTQTALERTMLEALVALESINADLSARLAAAERALALKPWGKAAVELVAVVTERARFDQPDQSAAMALNDELIEAAENFVWARNNGARKAARDAAKEAK